MNFLRWIVAVTVMATAIGDRSLLANGGHAGGHGGGGVVVSHGHAGATVEMVTGSHAGMGVTGHHHPGSTQIEGMSTGLAGINSLQSQLSVTNSVSAAQNSIATGSSLHHHGFERTAITGQQPLVNSGLTTSTGTHHVRHDALSPPGSASPVVASQSAATQSSVNSASMNPQHHHFATATSATAGQSAHGGTGRHGGHHGGGHGHWSGNWSLASATATVEPSAGHHHHGGQVWQSTQPYFWGTGSIATDGWGQGSLIYGSGYLNYLNPYYSSIDLTQSYNYTRPIVISYAKPQNANLAQAQLNAAVAAFLRRDFDLAAEIATRAINDYPNDAVLHEFRALALFAKGDYHDAAATIHAVLAIGPGWDWNTMISLYRDPADYTIQLRSLEAVTKQTPNDGAVRFLLAYHYLTDGYPDDAARILRRVVQLEPNDQIAANLLKMVAAPIPDAPAAETPSFGAIEPAKVVGTWRATRGDGAQFNLKISEDLTFTWSFSSRQSPPRAFNGSYALENDVLTLSSREQGSLAARVRFTAENQLNFRAVGAPDQDTGLDFQLMSAP